MRDRLDSYNTVEDAVKLIQSSKRIMILTGAGISRYLTSIFTVYFKQPCQVCPVEYLTSALVMDYTRQSRRAVNMSLMTLNKCKYTVNYTNKPRFIQGNTIGSIYSISEMTLPVRNLTELLSKYSIYYIHGAITVF